MIVIENQGQQISSTNYWDSEHAAGGFFYLSWNAGAARLLIPDNQKPSVRDMKSAKYVVISRGKLKPQGRDALEIMFEDNTDSPFVIHLSVEQTDRTLPDSKSEEFVVTGWTRNGQKFRLPGKYRVVDSLPCMAEWG